MPSNLAGYGVAQFAWGSGTGLVTLAPGLWWNTDGGSSPCTHRWATKATIIRRRGARPRTNAAGTLLVFDRKLDDGYDDLFTLNLSTGVETSLTDGVSGFNQLNNGNGQFHPSGSYIVFGSEEPLHYGLESPAAGDPGVGTYANLWATTPDGSNFPGASTNTAKLTVDLMRQTAADGRQAIANVNALFVSPTSLIWTQHYRDNPNTTWGDFRIMQADWNIHPTTKVPYLSNVRVIFTPALGNYYTAMAMPDADSLIGGGNLEGQSELAMSQYRVTLSTGAVTPRGSFPGAWEEANALLDLGLAGAVDRLVAVMTNGYAAKRFDVMDPNWPQQLTQREWYLTGLGDTSWKERITGFNDTSAPEYTGERMQCANCWFDPVGMRLYGTVAIDTGTDASGTELPNRWLCCVAIDLDTSVEPASVAGPADPRLEVAAGGALDVAAADLLLDVAGDHVDVVARAECMVEVA